MLLSKEVKELLEDNIIPLIENTEAELKTWANDFMNKRIEVIKMRVTPIWLFFLLHTW